MDQEKKIFFFCKEYIYHFNSTFYSSVIFFFIGSFLKMTKMTPIVSIIVPMAQIIFNFSPYLKTLKP